MKVEYWTITADQAGQRIDNYLLTRLKGVPKSRIYRLLRKGEVRVNKKRIKPLYRLQTGDELRIPPVRRAESPREIVVSAADEVMIKRAILYEDEDLLVINKPAGMAVHAGSGIDYGVIELLRAVRPEVAYLELVHRLDRQTSGCLMLAKQRGALLGLQNLFKKNQIDKRYFALLVGRWPESVTDVNLPLLRKELSSGDRIVVVDEAGKAALSSFQVIEGFAEASLVEVKLHTGRTHQIRVHAQAMGHPVIGDKKYGDEAFNQRVASRGVSELLLHAQCLTLILPSNGKQLTLEAPRPASFDDALEMLISFPQKQK